MLEATPILWRAFICLDWIRLPCDCCWLRLCFSKSYWEDELKYLFGPYIETEALGDVTVLPTPEIVSIRGKYVVCPDSLAWDANTFWTFCWLLNVKVAGFELASEFCILAPTKFVTGDPKVCCLVIGVVLFWASMGYDRERWDWACWFENLFD